MGVAERYNNRNKEENKTTLYNGVENRYKFKDIDSVFSNTSSRIDTWFNNSNIYFENAQNRFADNSTYRTADENKSWLDTIDAQKTNFYKEGESIKSVLREYVDFFGEDYVNYVCESIDNAMLEHNNVVSISQQDAKYWAQWGSAEEYNTAVRENGYYNKYSGMSYSEIQKALGDRYMQDGNKLTAFGSAMEDEEFMWLLKNQYNLIPQSADFAENSQYVSTYRGGEKFNSISGMYSDTGYDDIMYDLINGDKQAEQRQLLSEMFTSTLFGGSGTFGPESASLLQMTDDEVAVFNYLYATAGKEVAYNYIDRLSEDLNSRQREDEEEFWGSIAKEHPVIASGLTVLTSPMKAGVYIGQIADYAQDGKIDQNAGYNRMSYISSAVRDEVSGNIEEKWGPVGSFAYQTGMSMADFLFTTAASGGIPALSLTVMGTGAAADTVIATKDMGLSDDQAFWLGTAAGLIEVATELIGIDALLDFKTLKSSAGKYILQNVLAEGLEEGLSDVGNSLVELIDLALNGDKSKIKREISAIMQEQNVDEKTAVGKYVAGKFKELGLDMLGGAISGGVMGGGGAVVGSISNTVQGAKMTNAFGKDIGSYLTTEALEINPDNSFAQKMQGKLDSGKDLSNRQIGKLVQQNETAIYENDVASIQSTVEKRLTELGEQGDIKAIAAAITKKAQGERLTFAERELIKSSTHGTRVSNELGPVNMKSGKYSSSWANIIGTDEINADTYSSLVKEMEAESEAPKGEAQKANVPKTSETAKSTDAAAQESYTEAKEVPKNKNTTVEKNAAESEISAREYDSNTEDSTVTLEKASKKYGAQAGAMISTYTEGQDVARYDAAYQAAYNMGKSGVNLSYAMQSVSTAYLSESQRENAHRAGVDASSSEAKTRDGENKAKANGKTGRKKGSVKGEGVSISDLKKSFNDTQNTAYKLLSTYAEATGIDIVLYKSEANADGVFEGAQGKFKWREDTIYIDINAGLTNIKDVNELAKYTMMRTFSHEFTHFIEKWNPIWYNEFRKVVFDTLTERGENVEDLIDKKMAQSEGMSYDEASREVVAEAMTDILPDANFVEELATKHKNIFQQLLEKLKEFVADLKAYFNSLGNNPAREANALKEQVGESVKYVESIVKLFDKVAAEAVENYQMTVAIEEKAVTTETKKAEKAAKTEKTLFDKYNEAKAKYPDSIVIYRVGDFFEVLGDDATFVAKWTGLTLTSRNDPNTGRVAMVGFPFHTFERYVEKIRPHEAVTLVQEEGGIVKEYPKASTETAKTQTTVSKKTETAAPKVDNTEIEERQKEYKKKFSQWLKKAGRKYVLHYGGVSLLSADGAFAMRATDDEIGWARQEFSGVIYETALPKSSADMLDNATTLITEAPLEGKLGDDGVYIFNVDGKKQVFNKKLLSKLDGNLLYFGDFNNGFKVIKAVDAEGNVAGFLLPMRIKTEITDTKPSKLKSFSNKINSKISKQEVNTNVEETGTVLPHRGDGKGTSRLLAESQTEDVSRDGAERNAVADAGERRGEAGRSDNRSDAERSERGSGEGSSESRDLRGNDELSAEEKSARDYASENGYKVNINDLASKKGITQVDIHDKDGLPTFNPVIIHNASDWNKVKEAIANRENIEKAKAEKLHETATEQISQQSTEQPKGRNFVIRDSLDLPSGDKPKYKANIDAIRLVKQLETEGRYATEAEQAILAKYVGWGGLSNVFDERKTEWSKEYQELKELLTDDEYRAARASTTDAFYTDIPVIKAMYSGLEALGFTGGRVLEPSAGVGNFIGAMPQSMSAKVKSVTMVELDNITGLISKYLYPNADVRIQGFEKATLPDNYMDVAIGNVPFGNVAIYDKAYPKKVTSAIHNYFFAKSLDKVRTGGIVMFITSSYTMSSHDNAVRRYIMQKADLLGAIRLPNTAFKSNAGTDVVADILILKKRAPNTLYSGAEFLDATYNYNTGEYVNKYFESHPEMILGVPSTSRGRYGEAQVTYNPFTDRGSLADQIREAFSHIDGKMEYPATLSREKTNFAVERAGKKAKENSLVVKDGKVYQNRQGELVEVNTAKGGAERISGMLDIRDAAKDLMTYQQQGLNENEIKKARTKLNKAYDAFVKKYGYINSQANRNAIKDDPDKFSLFALEIYDSETKKATKADIFTKNTIAPNRTVTSAKDVAEGLIVSVNQTGGVDTALIARLTGRNEGDVTRELIDSRKAFKNRDGELEAAEVYLSGNVRAKLRDAESLVSLDPDYKNNVEALKSVIPADVGYQDIFVNAGTPWIPNSVYSDFAAYMLGSYNSEWRQNVDITRNRETGNFTVELKNKYLKTNAANTQKWGTSRRTFLELFDAMLNSKSVVIKDKLDDGSFVVNKEATAAANEKIENIQKEFAEWLWQDEKRRGELATLYNETFNSIVTPKYNGDNLTVNGANANKPLRPHQRNAVQRVISSGGNTLLAHKVGAGKTYEMAAAAMKLKELGLVKKPMFAVPKSLVAQWGNEFMDFFPTAKLLVAEASDFTAANRKVFMNRIATGEYDAVIVSYEQFEKLPMSDDFTRKLYQEQIDSIVAAIEEAKAEKGGKALSVKDLEKKRKSLQTKIEKLSDKAKDEGNIDFEELGVDSLFIDEAHNFKNLFYTTSMTNVSGLGNKDGSKRAFDLYTKVRYLQQLNGGKGIVFATATPVMNSMSEMYIMQKYLQPDLLNQLGLNTFDAWAKQFGEVVNGVEIKPSGQGYRVKQSFSRFKNMSELQLLFRNFADVLTDIPGLKIPTMKGGKVNVVVCEGGEFQQAYMKELENRADNIKNVDPSEDNMLKITSDGRKISYTQRMIDPSLPYEEGCKIYRCAENVIKAYNESKAIKGTQLIFCDMATPKGKSNTNATETEDIEMDMESAKLYDDIKAKLRQGGIPAKEIAFIHEADTDAKKKKLFSDVNEGKVRVLIGSTGKMGVGMNAQKRIVAIHHLDAPWRPGDVEQRNGRAFRQGNINAEVECLTYVTEGSFDARLWDILERKQNFINQVMNGESVGRETEDTGEVTLSAAEVKALASGSPLIMEQVQLDTDIKKLESLYKAHISAVRFAKERLARDGGEIAILEKQIAAGKADIAARVDTYSDDKFSLTVGKNKYTDKKDAGTALMAEATAKSTFDGYTTIGSFAGFDIRVIKSSEGIKGLLVGKQGYPFKTYSGNTTFMISQLIGVVESIDEKVKLWQHNITELEKDISEQEKLIAEPFAKQTELDEKRKRYNEVMDILNPKEEQSLDSVAEDTVQEQSRSYLENDIYEKETEVYASRKETRDEFKRVSHEEGYTVGERGQTAYAYKACRTPSENGQKVAEELKKLGIKGIIHEGLKTNYNGITTEYESGAATHEGFAVFINNETNRNPIETAGHEAFHYWEASPQRVEYRGVIYDNINFSSKEFIKFQSEIAADYFGDEVALDDKEWELLHEEIHAYITGYVYSGDVDNAVRPFLRNFDEVKSALNDFFESQKNNVQYQQRTNTLTDREILAMAADAIKESDLTDAERDALQIFKNRISKLETLQEERAEQGRLYKEQQFKTPVDRKAAEVTLNRMAVLDQQIKAAQAEALSLEDKKVLGDVLKKARKVVEADQRAHDAELVKRWRERTMDAAKIKKYRERIQKEVNELSSWVTKPNNKDIVKHIPDALKNSIIPFLTSIDFTSKQQLRGGEATKADAEFVKKLNALNAALKHNIDINGMYSGYNDLPPNFMENLQGFINRVNAIISKNSGQFVINEMTSEELKELASVVKVLKSYITQFNKFHANAMYSHVYDAGDNTIQALAEMNSDDGKSGGVSNFVLWQQMRPAFAFERFGNGGKAIYDGLRRGQAQLAFNTKKIVEFTEKTYTDKEVQAWEKEIKKIKLVVGEVKMRVSDMMSLYELSKQPDSLRHMLGEGMRVATYTLKGNKISDNGHPITEMDIATIVGQLTQRQKDVADALQKFMAEQGGAWGNYVSVARFGEEQFTNEKYFPINSDGRHLQSTADEYPSAASLYALLNMSFTKSRNELANNRIIVYSIFDVFSNHMASMAQYNAMALPVLDALKWFNYQQKTEDANGNKYVQASVREQMSRVYGVPEETKPGSGRQGYAESFVLNILKAFNGTEAQGVPADITGMNALRRYNMAQVAYNLRVVAQQPLAITRAALLIDYSSIIKGMKLKPDAIKQNIEEMRKYSGIAAWKSLGFYDVNISRGLADTIKHNSTVVQKIGEIGMWGAEQADTLTWAGIWSACKEDVIKKQKLTPKDAGFYEAVTKLFEDVIYKTQVVDSVLTKNEYMRSKGFFARAISSFMSEPVTTASMLIDAYDKYNADLKRGMNRQQAWEKNKAMIGRTMYVYAVSAVMLAAVQAVADAFRDDDEYEEWYEKWLEAFGGNLIDELMPFNKLPILSDFYDLAKKLLSIFGVDTYGNPPQSVFMQWYDSLVKGTEIIYKKIAGEDINYTWYGGIYKLLQAASGMSGLPMAAATREIIALWNNSIGAMAPSLKVKDYDPGDKNEIKYAYQDGHLTFDEAVHELMDKGLVDNEDEAYFTVSGWEAGEGYSRYDKIYDAIKSGGSIDEAMAELTSHGYTEKEVKSQIAEQIGKWYYDESSDYRITKQQAERMLAAYTDLTSEEITKKVNQWSAVVVTGIKYNDIDDEYLAGNITAERATEMYMRYGSMTKEEATEKVTVLSFVKEHPNLEGISYSAVSAYTEYCEPQGIDAEMFYNVWQFSSSATADVDRHGNIISGSKKAKILEYIDSLDLSRKQKDSLYYALGWSKNTISDAPWR